jgi:hypothetical protein
MKNFPARSAVKSFYPQVDHHGKQDGNAESQSKLFSQHGGDLLLSK